MIKLFQRWYGQRFLKRAISRASAEERIHLWIWFFRSYNEFDRVAADDYFARNKPSTSCPQLLIG